MPNAFIGAELAFRGRWAMSAPDTVSPGRQPVCRHDHLSGRSGRRLRRVQLALDGPAGPPRARSSSSRAAPWAGRAGSRSASPATRSPSAAPASSWPTARSAWSSGSTAGRIAQPTNRVDWPISSPGPRSPGRASLGFRGPRAPTVCASDGAGNRCGSRPHSVTGIAQPGECVVRCYGRSTPSRPSCSWLIPDVNQSAPVPPFVAVPGSRPHSPGSVNGLPVDLSTT